MRFRDLNDTLRKYIFSNHIWLSLDVGLQQIVNKWVTKLCINSSQLKTCLFFFHCTKWPGFLQQQLDTKLWLAAVLIKAILQELPLQSPLINLFSYLAFCAWPPNLSENSTYEVNHKPKFSTMNSNQLCLEAFQSPCELHITRKTFSKSSKVLRRYFT